MTAGRAGDPQGSAGEIFATFLKLGLISFGGPIAHLGYFRDELVVRRKWLSEPDYAELVALCQFLPGPASSQVGFALGLARAGPLGALAAWTAFTLPSALLMLALALVSGSVRGPVAEAVFHGLKLVAVVIVAQAVWGMARTLTPDMRRLAIAALAAAIVATAGSTLGQIGAILFGAAAGTLFCRHLATASVAAVPVLVSRRAGLLCLFIFGLMLVGLPLVPAATDAPGLRLFGIFYRAGALVFGGGHVVLPLLQAELVPGLMTGERFLAGYGAAQALPGPLFAIAAYLGGVAGQSAGAAMLALVGIFLPGLLLVVGVLPYWAVLRGKEGVRAGVVGVNAAVVGVLALALYDPLLVGSVGSIGDMVLVAVALFALLRWKLSPLAIVAALVAASLLWLAL